MKRTCLLLLVLGACGPSSESASVDGGATASTGCARVAEVTPTICSMAGAARNVVFTNGCKEAVDIWWVNLTCGETFYQRLEAGQSYTQGSFVTHPWRARTVPAGSSPGTTGGKLIKEFGAIPAGAGDLTYALP